MRQKLSVTRSVCATEADDENEEILVKIMGGVDMEAGGEFYAFNFTDALQRETYKQKSFWRFWLMPPIRQHVSLGYSNSLAFVCRINLVAIHFFLKLVCTARLYMKMVSWG